MDREHVHGGQRLLEVRCGRVVPGLAEQLQVRHDVGGPIGREGLTGALHQPQELGDVPALLLGERGVRVAVPIEQLRPFEEQEQQLSRRELRRPRRVVVEVGHQPGRGGHRVRGEAGALTTRDLLEQLTQGALPAGLGLGELRELGRRERIERRGREEVDPERVGGRRDRGEERHQEPDLLAVVELPAPGEVRRKTAAGQ